jgi:class 3 adenylate cyclase
VALLLVPQAGRSAARLTYILEFPGIDVGWGVKGHGMSDIVAPTSGASGAEDTSKAAQVKEGAANAAHDVRDEVSNTVADVKDQAVSEIGHVKDEVAHQASDLVHQTRQHVAQQADDGTDRLAKVFAAAGQELSAMAERSEQDGPMTNAVRQIGNRASSMGDRYQQGGRQALTQDVTAFARRSPGTFLLAAAAAGFVVGRIVRNADTTAIADAARPEPDPTSASAELGTQSPGLARPAGASLGRDGEPSAGASIGLGSDAAAEAAVPLSPAGTGTVL